MKLYDKVNNREAVRSQYEKLNNILMQELGVKPNTEIQDWFEEWKQIYS